MTYSERLSRGDAVGASTASRVDRVPEASLPDVDYATRHLRVGWWTLLVFATLGLVLETLHGFKVRAYLDVSNETRRLMWTLAHAHGTLLAFVHVLFGLSLKSFPDLASSNRRIVSSCLVWAGILLPGGFFLGGVSFYAGDPGLGAIVVPIGATLLLMAVLLVARGVGPVETSGGAARVGPPRGPKRKS